MLTLLVTLFLYGCFLTIVVVAWVAPPGPSLSLRQHQYHVPLRSPSPQQQQQQQQSHLLVYLAANNFDMSELSRRMETIRETEQHQSDRYRYLPVLSFDSILPGQKLEGQTTDPTFCRVLQTWGLGGTFVMTSIHASKRMVRRNGVICKIEIMDAKARTAATTTITEREPTAVAFVIVAIQWCRLIGSAEAFQTRVGRWRRAYDPDGEESRLGWGTERFVDVVMLEPISTEEEQLLPTENEDVSSLLHFTEPSSCWVDCQPVCDSTRRDSSNQDEQVQALLQENKILLEQWETLAADPKTYDNVNVVAASRIRHGMPGLRIDPAALLRQVKANLGDMPTSSATDFAMWGAALINPMPALGVAPEIRGRILEAPSTIQRLEILRWGINRSMKNLLGIDPL